MSMSADDNIIRPDRHLRPLPQLIFSSRWLQLPLYVGLIVAQAVYVVLFLKELWHLIHGALMFTEQDIMLIVLGLIDVVMISNLLIMVIVGGYETFVSRLELEKHPDQPEWLSHVNASVLKIKLAMAIIGISSIHLLRRGEDEFRLGRRLFRAAGNVEIGQRQVGLEAFDRGVERRARDAKLLCVRPGGLQEGVEGFGVGGRCETKQQRERNSSPRHGRACPGHPRLHSGQERRGCPAQGRA